MKKKEVKKLKTIVLKLYKLSADINEQIYDEDAKTINELQTIDQELDKARIILENLPVLADVDWEMEIEGVQK